jgi:hypothetical protein
MSVARADERCPARRRVEARDGRGGRPHLTVMRAVSCRRGAQAPLDPVAALRRAAEERVLLLDRVLEHHRPIRRDQIARAPGRATRELGRGTAPASQSSVVLEDAMSAGGASAGRETD